VGINWSGQSICRNRDRRERVAHSGAAIPENYSTAWQLLVVMGALKRDETYAGTL
jgi:hypothetical protein